MPFDFSEMFGEFIIGARTMTDEKRQSFVIEMPDDPIWLDADRSRLVQILNNLASNASKYSAEESTITLEITTDADELTIEIRDNGIGISEDDLKQVFEPFFRSKSIATRQELGTGLGLSVVKSLVELHSGSIEITSELDRGTQVLLKIPRIIQPQ
ncbi:sensor histidine kinase [Candidatus Lucifugimonas marina]